MTDIMKQFAETINLMDPNTAQKWLEDIRNDVERAQDQKLPDKARVTALEKKTEDQLLQDIAAYDPRTGDRQAYLEFAAVLREKQEARVSLSKKTSMKQVDYDTRNAMRNELTAEYESIKGLPATKGGKPTAAKLRRKEIGEELSALNGQPDLVIPTNPPPTTPPEKTPEQIKKEYWSEE